ncbi:DUF3631 domain-containing protein [Microbacterium sp. F2]|uniref:DUF3631 domain-containing protein n=1 Tax=Microbacterium sp. F2 TaxID=3422228 RepID=UPI003FD00BAA
MAYPHAHALVAHALWIAHTHVIDCFYNTPRIAFLSVEPGSGKSRALEVTSGLVTDPVHTVNVSAAYLFRRIAVDDGDPLPTVLFDEVDAVFTKRPSEATEEKRAMLNSGYRRGATVGRAVPRGKEIFAEEWSSFCPVALAGLNDLPDTLMTRSVVVRMRRRSPGERVEPYRPRDVVDESNRIRAALSAWADSVRDDLRDGRAVLPEQIQDRNADVWEPLVLVADAAGGNWPTLARSAALHMIGEQDDRPATIGIRLLADIRTVMREHHALPTTDLIEKLCALDAAPWGVMLSGQPINPNYLSRKLKQYDIPTGNTIRLGAQTHKGFYRHHFADAWERYLPPDPNPTPDPQDPHPTLIDDEPF